MTATLTVGLLDLDQLVPDVARVDSPFTVTCGWRPATAQAVVDGLPRWAMWAVPPALPDPLYDDGRVTLYGGVGAGDILPRLDVPDGVLITDPPYGISHASSRRGTSAWHGQQIAGDRTTDVRDDVLAWWHPRPAIVFSSPKLPAPPGSTGRLVWGKWPLGSGDLRVPYRPDMEDAHVIGFPWADGLARTSSMLDYPPVQSTAKNGRLHAHQKPLPLMVELVGKTTGTVIDPFAGSGTTLLAAKALGRRAIGIELDPAHAATAAARLADDTPDVYPPAVKGSRMSTKPTMAGRRFHPRRQCLPDGRPDDARTPTTATSVPTDDDGTPTLFAV